VKRLRRKVREALVRSVRKLEVRWKRRKESIVPKRTFSGSDFSTGMFSNSHWILNAEK
jgi:hypothetical protein